ncbi:MAG: DegV family protein [Anaerolineales bacterium]|jgi:DegV family protein with EDD domain
MSVRIVTDSTCDLPQEVIDRYEIEVVPLYINVGDKSYRDGIDLSREQFYQRLPGWNPPPTTAAPGAKVFKQIYDRLAGEGASEVLSIHISVSLSATPDVARQGADMTSSVPVTVLDSRQLSLGTGFIVERAAREARAGRTVAEILPILEEQIQRTHVFAALDTLEYLRRSGRMNGAIAGIGSLLQVKPLLKMYDGNPTSERIRTQEAAHRRLLALLEQCSPVERIALVHTNAAAEAYELLARVESDLPRTQVESVDITPVIGAHIGPGAIGFALVQARRNEA